MAIVDGTGLSSVADASALFATGWAEGTARARTVAAPLARVIPPVKQTRRRVRWADTGNELHLDRALRGEWDTAWRNTQRVDGAPKVLTLHCAFGGQASVSVEQFFWCGAQMLVVTDLLEDAGYAVELHAINCGALPHGRTLVDITAKRAHDPLRTDTVMAIFGHAGVFRTFGFALRACGALDMGSGMGRTENAESALATAIAAGRVAVPDFTLPHAYDLETATANIMTTLNTLGVV